MTRRVGVKEWWCKMWEGGSVVRFCGQDPRRDKYHDSRTGVRVAALRLLGWLLSALVHTVLLCSSALLITTINRATYYDCHFQKIY